MGEIEKTGKPGIFPSTGISGGAVPQTKEKKFKPALDLLADAREVAFEKKTKPGNIFQNMFSEEIPNGTNDYEFYAYKGIGRKGLGETTVTRNAGSMALHNTREVKTKGITDEKSFSVLLSAAENPDIIRVELGKGSFNGKITANGENEYIIAGEGRKITLKRDGQFISFKTENMNDFVDKKDLDGHDLDSLTFKLKIKK